MPIVPRPRWGDLSSWGLWLIVVLVMVLSSWRMARPGSSSQSALLPAAPMSAHKKVHIRKISQIESVQERWQAQYHRPPNEEDVEAMFQDFVPLQLACLANYADLILGTVVHRPGQDRQRDRVERERD